MANKINMSNAISANSKRPYAVILHGELSFGNRFAWAFKVKPNQQLIEVSFLGGTLNLPADDDARTDFSDYNINIVREAPVDANNKVSVALNTASASALSLDITGLYVIGSNNVFNIYISKGDKLLSNEDYKKFCNLKKFQIRPMIA